MGNRRRLIAKIRSDIAWQLARELGGSPCGDRSAIGDIHSGDLKNLRKEEMFTE